MCLGPAGYREMALAGAVSGHSQVRVTSQWRSFCSSGRTTEQVPESAGSAAGVSGRLVRRADPRVASCCISVFLHGRFRCRSGARKGHEGVHGFAALADPHERSLACRDEPVSGASLVTTSRASLGLSLTSPCAEALSTVVTRCPPGRRTRAASAIIGSGFGTGCRTQTIVTVSRQASATASRAASIQTAVPGRRTYPWRSISMIRSLTATR